MEYWMGLAVALALTLGFSLTVPLVIDWLKDRRGHLASPRPRQSTSRLSRGAVLQRRRESGILRARTEFYSRVIVVALIGAIILAGFELWRHTQWPAVQGAQTVVIESIKLDMKDVPTSTLAAHRMAWLGMIVRLLFAAAIGIFLTLAYFRWRGDVKDNNFWRQHELATSSAFVILAALLSSALSGLFDTLSGDRPTASPAMSPELITVAAPPYPKFVLPPEEQILATIYFDTEESAAPASSASLTALGAALRACATVDSQVVLNVKGVASSVEFRRQGRITDTSRASNLALANKRAGWVRDRLRAEAGDAAIDVESVEAESYDEVAQRRLVVDRPGEVATVSGIEGLNQAARIILVDAGRCRRK